MGTPSARSPISTNIGSYARGESKRLKWVPAAGCRTTPEKRYSGKNDPLTLRSAFRNASSLWSRRDLLEGWSRNRKRQTGRRALAIIGTVIAVALKVIVEGSIPVACR